MSVPATEAVNPDTHDLDTREVADIVALLAREQVGAAQAVARATPEIARAVDAIVARLRGGGTLHYVGAGTSGRLATLDAAECPPTFGTPPSLVVAHVAGGAQALARAVEGAEDDAAAGELAMQGAVDARDAVVGISASGGAPFVVAAVRAARALGAVTVAVVNAPRSPLEDAAGLSIVVDCGPEPIAGSTRLKAGTAQKLVLNAISTATMIRLGKVYDNLMVDVVATNRKLRARAIRLVGELANVDAETAATLLAACGGSVKVAVVSARRGIDAPAASALLAAADGFLRDVIE